MISLAFSLEVLAITSRITIAKTLADGLSFILFNVKIEVSFVK